MALDYLLSTTILFILLCCYTSKGQDYYSITRSTSLTYDVVQVPQCLTCSKYVDANTHDSSNCQCACKYESSTFVYLNSGWMCQDNALSRQQAGKGFLDFSRFLVEYVKCNS